MKRDYELIDLIEGMYSAIRSKNHSSQINVLCDEAGWTRSLVTRWRQDPDTSIQFARMKGWVK